MKPIVHLLAFANVDLKKVPKRAKLEYQGIPLGEEKIQLLQAPLIVKEKQQLNHLYYDFDQLSPDEQEFYASQRLNYEQLPDGTYQLAIKSYVFKKKRLPS